VGLSGNTFANMTTGDDGHYIFSALDEGFDFTITPLLDVNPLNGVSTFDLVLMSKHILGTQRMDSPYKLIAADINNDKRVTAMDAIQLRRLILNIDIHFENNTSWRFIPADYVFPNPENPWQEAFPEIINVNDLAGALSGQDFVAAKIGDIDLNAKVNAMTAQTRTTQGQFLFNLENQELIAGNEYYIPFRSNQIDDIQGYQFTLDLDKQKVELVDIRYQVITAENFGFRMLDEGLITTSWNKSGQLTERFGKEEVLFTLVIKAINDAPLSEVLRVNSRLTTAEAYDLNDGLMDVGFEFNHGAVTKAGFELYQNTPNPFHQETLIGFNLPKSEMVSLRILDASGKLVRLIRQEGKQGYNQILLDREDLPAGILTYTLTAGDHTATKRMITIE
jgi:hypothetical protein